MNKEKRKIYQKAYYIKHQKKILAKVKKYAVKHKKERKKYLSEHKNEIVSHSQNYYIKHKKKLKAYSVLYRKTHKEETKLYNKSYYAKYQKKAGVYRKVYRINHRKEINVQKQKRRSIDPKFRLNEIISNSIRVSLKGNKADRHWEELVGYTLDKLKKHFEKQFTEGMTWKNYGRGGWEIDHKIPVSVFNFTKPEHDDFLKCFALKNLQPLWAKDNLIKSNKLDKHFQPSLLL